MSQLTTVAGETFIDLADAQRRVEEWCRERAGSECTARPNNGPPRSSPPKSNPVCSPGPTAVYGIPIYATAKVHRDHQIEVARSLYSGPRSAHRCSGRGPRRPVAARIFHRGQLVKVHPARHRAAARPTPKTCRRRRRSTPCGTSTSCKWLPSTGRPSAPNASALLDIPLPWTKMPQSLRPPRARQEVGPARVEAACTSALERATTAADASVDCSPHVHDIPPG